MPQRADKNHWRTTLKVVSESRPTQHIRNACVVDTNVANSPRRLPVKRHQCVTDGTSFSRIRRLRFYQRKSMEAHTEYNLSIGASLQPLTRLRPLTNKTAFRQKKKVRTMSSAVESKE
ncbi:hypothetical protein MRX96_025462 [Rhipicephalus microplus]